MTALTRTDRSLVGQWWWTVDRWSAAAVVSLVAIGTVLSFAASPSIARKFDYPTFHFVYRTFMYSLPALTVLFSVSLMNPRQLRRLSAIVFFVGVALMGLALVAGSEVNGAHRWIKLGPLSIQPSEFVKPAFVVLSAWLFAASNRVPGFPGNLLAGGLLALVGVLLLQQPDLGQLLLLTAVWGGMFFMAGIPLVWLGILGAGSIIGAISAYSLFPHVTSRVDRFLDPEAGDTYQVDKALEAFQQGGLLGRGPGEGQIKNFIPDAHTDFVFAVAGEEYGLLACLILVGIFCFIVTRGFLRAMEANDQFVQLAAGGLVALFGLQAFINMGVSLSLMPAKGMTLPFVSYGGSSLIATALSVGMLLALTRKGWAGHYGVQGL